MKIVFGAVTILDQEQPRTADVLRVDCAPRTEVLQLFSAASSTPVARGGRSRSLPLTIATEFASQRLAEEYFLDHYDTLADVGTLTFTCGYTGDTSTRTVDAVLERCSPRLVAANVVEVDYLFTLSGVPAAP